MVAEMILTGIGAQVQSLRNERSTAYEKYLEAAINYQTAIN